MKTLLLVLALTVPLMAQTPQDSTSKESDDVVKRSPFWAVRTLQDMEWRKFEAAHRRAHSKRGQEQTYIRESKRHNWKRTISYIVVGGLGYYIGTLEHKEKYGKKRRPYMGDRK